MRRGQQIEPCPPDAVPLSREKFNLLVELFNGLSLAEIRRGNTNDIVFGKSKIIFNIAQSADGGSGVGSGDFITWGGIYNAAVTYAKNTIVLIPNGTFGQPVSSQGLWISEVDSPSGSPTWPEPSPLLWRHFGLRKYWTVCEGGVEKYVYVNATDALPL